MPNHAHLQPVAPRLWKVQILKCLRQLWSLQGDVELATKVRLQAVTEVSELHCKWLPRCAVIPFRLDDSFRAIKVVTRSNLVKTL